MVKNKISQLENDLTNKITMEMETVVEKITGEMETVMNKITEMSGKIRDLSIQTKNKQDNLRTKVIQEFGKVHQLSGGIHKHIFLKLI